MIQNYHAKVKNQNGHDLRNGKDKIGNCWDLGKDNGHDSVGNDEANSFFGR